MREVLFAIVWGLTVGGIFVNIASFMERIGNRTDYILTGVSFRSVFILAIGLLLTAILLEAKICLAGFAACVLLMAVITRIDTVKYHR